MTSVEIELSVGRELSTSHVRVQRHDHMRKRTVRTAVVPWPFLTTAQGKRPLIAWVRE